MLVERFQVRFLVLNTVNFFDTELRANVKKT